jgi:hypothetical protein
MNFARALIRELVDKRLWPIAIVLAVALVALPVLLSAGGDRAASGDAPLLAGAPADSGATKVAAVELAGPPSVRSRPGKVRNPFRRTAEKTAGAQTSAAPAPAGGGVTATDEPAQSGGATAPEATETVPKTPTAAPAYYRTVVRWYEATGGTSRPLSRLTPLGDRADLAALYLGVTSSDARYAVFLLGPNATAEGEANCEDTSNCRLIGLRTGATQVITVQPTDGGEARRYHLEVVSAKAVTTTAAQARTMRDKVHSDGRDVMRELWQDAPTATALRPMRYEPATGLLYESSATTSPEKTAK